MTKWIISERNRGHFLDGPDGEIIGQAMNEARKYPGEWCAGFSLWDWLFPWRARQLSMSLAFKYDEASQTWEMDWACRLHAQNPDIPFQLTKICLA